MGEQTDLSIVIEIINKASDALKQVEKDLGLFGQSTEASLLKAQGAFASAGEGQDEAIKSYMDYKKGFENSVADLNKDLSSTDSASKKLVTSLKGISTESVTSALKLVGIAVSAKIVISALQETMQVAGQVETSLLGLSATARSFGEDAGKARDAVKSLTQDGLMDQIQAAEGLQEIMNTGLGLDDATKMMERFKDMAAFGGKNTIAYDEKLRMLFESFRTGYSIQAKNAGLMMTWDQVMQIGADKMGIATNKSGDLTKQLTLGQQAEAKYLGVMEITNGAVGDAAMYSNTYAGSVEKLKSSQIELQAQIGKGLLPAFELFSETITKVEKGLSAVRVVTSAFGTAFLGLQVIAQEVGNFFDGVLATIFNGLDILKQEVSTITLDPRTWFNSNKDALQRFTEDTKYIWKSVGDDAVKIGAETQEAINKTWDTGASDIADTLAKSSNDWLNQQTAATQKMTDDLAKENKAYAKEVAQREKDFEASFDELVMAHRDKISQLTTDLKTENDDYKKQVATLALDFDSAMRDIEKSHTDKTNSILADIQAEKDAATAEIEALTETYTAQTNLTSSEGNARLQSLQGQLAKEEALGSKADQSKIDAIKKMIAYEQAGLDQTLTDQKTSYDEDVSDVNATHDKKIEDLKASLEEENALYIQDVADKKSAYDTDVANAKEAHQKKVDDLQTQLDAETAIREKYAADFARIGDQQIADDLTKAVQKHTDEMAQLAQDHLDKVAEIKGTAYDAGVADVTGRIQGATDALEQNKDKLEKIKDYCLLSDYVSSKTGSSAPLSGIAGMNLAADGGLVTSPTIAGEAGPEVVLPLNDPKRMDSIMRSMGLGGNKGREEVSQTFNVVINNPQDIDILMERAGFAFRNGGGFD